jgi:MraZ protein
MSGLLGEHDCKLDAKSRLALPAGLLRQLPPEVDGRFVINRGFEQHLNLFPLPTWQRISTEIGKLNLYVRKNRQFVRYFHRGATELKLDSHNRLLLPRRLLEYAGIKNEVMLSCYLDRIEIWSTELYDRALLDEPDDFARLAEETMGGLNPTDNGGLIH